MEYHVSYGCFGRSDAPAEYYVADEDGTVVRRGFVSEDEAEAVCDEMNGQGK